jgi:inorganic pyrophosphatase
MQEEFELTYLAKTLPDSFSFETKSKEILDIYLPAASEHATLRIRKRGDLYEITRKEPVSGTNSSHQTENTIPLTKEEFADLSTVAGKRVRKVRYYYEEKGTTYEIDIFQDALKGLVLVEVEFKSNEEKSAYVPPAWVLADVTQEKFVAGGVLCGKSYGDIENELVRYGYTQVTAQPLESNISLLLAQKYLGAKVEVIIDRPLGSKHPKHGFIYEVNYGYLKGVAAPDGEDLDAYVLGVAEPLENATGICVAIAHRKNDDDDKLIVVPEGVTMTDEEILTAIHFQEQWFETEIVR